MMDLETMGTRPGSVILSIGAVTFDPKTGDIGSAPFYATITSASCIDAGLTVDPATRKWWKRQSIEARAAVTRDTRPLREVAQAFREWFRASGATFVWGQGASFDPPLWEVASRAVGIEPPWRFWNIRDTRTVYHLCDFDDKALPREGTYHNALDDARHQVLCVAAALAQLRKVGERA
ncbi:MAG: 3'-5' exoribonuclease [Rhodobacteraceae bacterium]|nr:3'-5' exoribonuclease [Paracoccaceae bacterium]